MISGIFILLGSNLGDRKKQLDRAVELIEQSIGAVVARSAVYETASWGIEEQPSFYNQVVEVDTGLSPFQLLTHLNDIEAKMGRKRHVKWGSRLIDLDILYYKKEIIDTVDLRIPHPGIPNRKFTLIPLVELCADFEHPVSGLNQSELLEKTTDRLDVYRLKESGA